MRFRHNDMDYVIDFTREHRKVRVGVDVLGNDIMGDSKYYYTIVTIYRFVDPTDHKKGVELFRTAYAGCSPKDKFTLEQGRLAALRNVSKTLSKEMKTAMWQAYMGRFDRKKK